MRTVKPYTTKASNAAELFGTKTCGYSSKAIKVLQNRIIKLAKESGHRVEFFTADDITLLTYYKNEITILMDIPAPTMLFSNTIVDNTENTSWRFGFMNRLTGKIDLLFGGCSVADADSAVDIFKITCELVRLRFQPTVNEELIPFSIKKYEK